MARNFAVLFGLVAVAACSPAEITAPLDGRPAIEVVGAESGSRLFVDGLDMGAVNQPLLLEPGSHMVKVVAPAGRTYSETVFLSGRGTVTLKVPAGETP